MAETTEKTWKSSKYRKVYLKVALMYLTTPSKVYSVAHQSHSNTIRESMIRAKLLQYGVLRPPTHKTQENVNLEEKHL